MKIISSWNENIIYNPPVKYDDTVASRCRYGDCAQELVKNMKVMYESSNRDYQGSAYVLAHDGSKFFSMWWSYGSCSECDEWESRDLSPEQVTNEIRNRQSTTMEPHAMHKFLLNTLRNEHLNGDEKQTLEELIEYINTFVKS